eukprot:TRINITY_DN75027_c0_g1_i1.p1 TRINITY_DN75027_c0_g1~~TRINITY_DN75027_c0_g1_i1.p1  ORF type:complete len:280 (+),score=20.20 TRINITY_DN75027_c0_g1_i1:93-932(+)
MEQREHEDNVVRPEETIALRLHLVLIVVPWGFFFLGLPCGYGWPSFVFKSTCACFSYGCFLAVCLPPCKQCALHLATISKSIASALVAMTWCSSISVWYAFLVIDVCFVVLLTSFFGFSPWSRIAHASLCMILSVGATTHFAAELTKGSFYNVPSQDVDHWVETLIWTMVLLSISIWFCGLNGRMGKFVHRLRQYFFPSSSSSDTHNQAGPVPIGVLPRVALESTSFRQGAFEEELDLDETLDGLHRYLASRRGRDRSGVGASNDEECPEHQQEELEGG